MKRTLTVLAILGFALCGQAAETKGASRQFVIESNSLALAVQRCELFDQMEAVRAELDAYTVATLSDLGGPERADKAAEKFGPRLTLAIIRDAVATYRGTNVSAALSVALISAQVNLPELAKLSPNNLCARLDALYRHTSKNRYSIVEVTEALARKHYEVVPPSQPGMPPQIRKLDDNNSAALPR